MVRVILDLLQLLMPGVVESYHKVSPLGSTSRAQKALQDLKTLTKTVETADNLMVSDYKAVPPKMYSINFKINLVSIFKKTILGVSE